MTQNSPIPTPVLPRPTIPGMPVAPAAPAAPVHPIPNVLIIGESGSGKTRSLRNLPWASGEVAYVDTEKKGFSWVRSIPADCYFSPTGSDDVIATLQKIEVNPKFKIVVVDSFTGYAFNMVQLDCAQRCRGDTYKAYAAVGEAILTFLNRVSSPRKRYIVTAIPEILQIDSGGNTYNVPIKRAAVPGRVMEGKVEAAFSYAVFLKVIVPPILPGSVMTQRPTHKFVLYTDGVTTAKIPEGVTDQIMMDNDVNELLKLAAKAEAAG